MELGERMRTQPVYFDGDGGKYRTKPGPYPKPMEVFIKTKDGEKKIHHSNNGFCSAIVYNGKEITREEYLAP